LVKKFDLGAGSWGDDIVTNLSQPTSDNIPDDLGDSESRLIDRLRKEMNQAASRLDFENAARLRDRIFQLENSNSN
jgi:excinuclease UvrABC nuclease subunit